MNAVPRPWSWPIVVTDDPRAEAGRVIDQMRTRTGSATAHWPTSATTAVGLATVGRGRPA